MFNGAFALNNQLLASLFASTYQHILPDLENISLSRGQVVHESGETITEVYFPQDAIFSLVLVLSNQSTTEIASVGNEGMVGLTAIWGGNSTTTRTIVQIPGTAWKLPAEVIKVEFQRGKELQKLLLLYTQAQFSQVSQIAACRSHHGIEQRLARWLLLVHDSLQKDTLPLTQKFIALMLGVRRASVTEIAISFQKQGMIRYSRGNIIIINRLNLEDMVCECYGTIKSEYKRLLKTKPL
ncbi:MAG: Crp/Fnr family transcriptional regulator [Spirulinaceae cyanobacterium]